MSKTKLYCDRCADEVKSGEDETCQHCGAAFCKDCWEFHVINCEDDPEK